METFGFELDPEELLAGGNDLLEIVEAFEREFEGSAFSWTVLDTWEDYEDFWVQPKPGADPAAIDTLETRLARGPVSMSPEHMRVLAAQISRTIWGAFEFVLHGEGDESGRVKLFFGAFDSTMWEFETTDRALHDRALRALTGFDAGGMRETVGGA